LLLHKRARRLSLVWLPRDDNDLADAISKENFSSFEPTLRMQVSLDDFPLMNELIQSGEDMYDMVKLCKKLPRLPDILPSSQRAKVMSRWG
jgi:hypothetical protein